MHLDRLKDQIVLTAAEGTRAWMVVISDTTGQMAATASSNDHTFVLFGACTPPQQVRRAPGGPAK